MAFENRYRRADRWLHHLAFGSSSTQDVLTDIEDAIFGRKLRDASIERPVLISGLPRSGTTILLELLADTGAFAVHRYRDMPFVLSPLLWNRFSALFQATDAPRERAHGDGIQVSIDSPEALEEVLWRRHWSDHYRNDRIIAWAPGETSSDFDRALDRHLRAILLVRGRGSDRHLRYLSKNNANISRLAALPAPFADATVLVPFRDPIQHATSLLRQHRRFLELHAGEPFAATYMTDVGHMEFGLAHRPVDFGGWLEAPDSKCNGPDDFEYWLRYWISAYRYVLEVDDPRVALVSFESLVGDSRSVLERIGQLAGIEQGALAARADRIRAPRAHESHAVDANAALLEEAKEIYRTLQLEAVRAEQSASILN